MRIKCKKSFSWKSRCLRFQNTCISSGRYVSLFLRMLRFQKQGLRKGSSLLKNVSSLHNIKKFHFSLKYLSCKISPTQWTSMQRYSLFCSYRELRGLHWPLLWRSYVTNTCVLLHVFTSRKETYLNTDRSNKRILCITRTVKHNYILPLSTVRIQLHVSAL